MCNTNDIVILRYEPNMKEEKKLHGKKKREMN